MKIFVSSPITGMEPFRAAAREAIIQLGHEPVMAEDIGAQPGSPQIACLQGLRQSAAVILILGADYGAKQPSGLSPTHEEYREAKDKRPVLAFVQDGVNRDPDQATFVNEVQAWDSGLFRDGFSSPEQLRAKITLRLHEWEVATMAGPVDEREMLQRALSLVPEERRGYSRSVRTLVLAIASSARQPILRPAEIEQDAFHEELLQAALFGPQRLFTPSKPTTTEHSDGVRVARVFTCYGIFADVWQSSVGRDFPPTAPFAGPRGYRTLARHAPVTGRRGGQPVSARYPNSSIAPELMSPLFYLRPGRVEQLAIPFARMMERLTP
jgi:Domain of unknown function (DUF4062)